MYGYLLLKIQKKEISKETQAAVNQISKLLRLLSEKYKTMYQEEE
jgi:very-short-patch-repair endonuclease